jgi:hypothetical protein
MLRILASLALAALVTGCTDSQSSAGLPSGTSSGQLEISRASGSCCNIYWNKKRVDLRYGAKAAKAILTYWAPNGYYTEPPYCKDGGSFSATPGRSWGNPSGYEHVAYSFQAEGPEPDRCGFTAVLSGTGSPPIAVIEVNIR